MPATRIRPPTSGGGSNAPAGPAITAQPQSVSVITDATATLSVTATGDGLSYQWYRDDMAIAGATNATFTTPAASYLNGSAQNKD